MDSVDEIHNRTKWKDTLKEHYDQFHETFRFVVSRSVRLDLFRQNGDALIARYFLFHLFPFSLSEMRAKRFDELRAWHEILLKEKWLDFFFSIADGRPLPYDLCEQAYEFGPFPELFIEGRYGLFKHVAPGLPHFIPQGRDQRPHKDFRYRWG
ncbi:MAG: AAA family ATPase [Thermodesulfobacteriota bacterium]|nr:AAA family ATPase [Thermodesulfobacteriota bacterium]